MKKSYIVLIVVLSCLLVNASWVGATVNLAGGGSGTVTSSPAGINCGASCNALFLENTTVTLTAAPVYELRP